MTDQYPDWRQSILLQLQNRNAAEQKLLPIISAYAKAREQHATLEKTNKSLLDEVDHLKAENADLELKLRTGAASLKAADKVQTLEQKVFSLQEELSQLLREKGTNAQQIVKIAADLHTQEQLLQDKELELRDARGNLLAMQQANSSLHETIASLESSHQVVKDEQMALQMAYKTLEGKFRQISDENTDLVQRWMQHKAKDADRLNEENDRRYRQKKQKEADELRKATETDVKIVESPSWEGRLSTAAICVVSVPVRAQCKCDAHDGEVCAVKWCPSAKFFATGGSDRKLKFWSTKEGRLENVATLTGSNAAIMSIEFDQEEQHILAASNDFASRVWSIGDHRLRHTLTGHSGKVLTAKFFGENTKVVTGSHDRTLKIWCLQTKACTKTIFAGSSCNDLVIAGSLDNTIISGHFDRKIRFWDPRADQSSNELSLQGRVTSLDLSADRSQLLASTREDLIKIIDLRMNQVRSTLSADGFHVGVDYCRAVFSPDAEYVCCGSQDGSLFVWRTAKGEVETVLPKEHGSCVLGCSWSPAGNSVVSVEKQRRAILWSSF